MWAAQYIDFKHPRTFLTSGSMGTMGFGLPAAIGAQIANPGKLVIDVDGDGSIRMNLGDLETLTTYDIPVKVLLLNNLGDGMVRQWQDLFYTSRYAGTDKSLHKKDFIKAAEADGFPFARRVSGKGGCAAGPRSLLRRRRPRVSRSDDRHPRPRVPDGWAGDGVQRNDTGKWIPARELPKKDEPSGSEGGGTPTGYF
jgi:acetolactate synthase-1/2/3 large subunit